MEQEAALRQTLYASLWPVALGLSLVAFLFALVQPWVMNDPSGGGLRWLALGSAVTLVGLGVSLRRWPGLARYAHPIGASLVGIIWLNVFAHLAFTGDPRHTTNLALVMVGLGFFFLSTPWFMASLAVMVGSWLGLVAVVGLTPEWRYYTFHLLAATLLAGLGHFTRRQRLLQQATLHLQLEYRQRELEQSEDRFRALSEGTSDGIVVHEAGVILDANQAEADLLGYTLPELIGKHVLDFVAPDMRAATLAQMSGEDERTYETICLRKDGATFPAEVSRKRIHYHGRNVRVAMVRDLTERKRAEAALREAESKYRNLVEHNPAVVYTDVLNEHSSTLYISPRVEALTGYTSAEWMNDPQLWEKLIHPDDYPAVMAEHMRTNVTHEPFRAEYRLVARDGRVVWVHDEATLIRAEAGQAAFWHGYLLDITDLKLAEMARQESEQRYRDLFISAQRQAQELALLDKVRTALVQKLDLPSVNRAVVDNVAETFGYTLVSIYMIQGDELILQHQVGYNRVIERIPRGQGVLWRIIQSGEPLLIKDVRAEPDFLEAISDIVSEIAVPLTDQGQPVGGLNVESVHGVPLDETDLRVLAAVGRQASIAIERARLYAQIRDNESARRSRG